MKRVAVVINFLTDYRVDLYRRLVARDDLQLTIFCHEPPAALRVKSAHAQFPQQVRLIEGRFFGEETVVLSRLPWRELSTRYDAVFIEGNPRYLSLAALATWLRLTRRNVILWTMVHSFRNSAARQSWRLRWTRLFSKLLVYTDAEASLLREQNFRASTIIGINNGLDQARIDQVVESWQRDRLAAWQAGQGLAGRTVLLTSARLIAKNKFEQVLQVLAGLRSQHPNIVWCAIGDGPELPRLKEQAANEGLSDHVRFVGALHDEDQLAPWFLSADLLVHPGAIGLSLLHAFGYGLPVVTHGARQRHGPEFAAFTEELTGRTFIEDDVAGFRSCVDGLLSDSATRARMSEQARTTAQTRFNTQVMAQRFVDCI